MTLCGLLLLLAWLHVSQSLMGLQGTRENGRSLRFSYHTLRAKQPRSRSQQQVVTVEDEKDSDVELTRAALVAIIDDSWRRVLGLVSPSLLKQCEDELKGATSLLVLATVRKAADANPESRATVEEMFKEADKDGDGQITFLEWFEWVSQDAAYFGSDVIDDTVDDDGSTMQVDQEDATTMRSRQVSKRRRRQKQQKTLEQFEARQLVKETRLQQLDPMVTGLAQVLGHAVCTLQVAARLPSNDPSYLAAAFVSGGTMAGAMDETLTRTMLSRLSPRTRDLVALALTLEVASMATESNFEGRMGVMFEKLDDARAKTMPGVSQNMLEGSQESYAASDEEDVESIVDADGAYVDVIEEGFPEDEIDVIQTVDLSSIPVQTAPSIDELVPRSLTEATPVSVDNDDGDDDFDDNFDFDRDGNSPLPLEVEVKLAQSSLHKDSEGVNSWKVEDDEIVESNQFQVEEDPTIYVGELVDMTVDNNAESIPIDTVLSSAMMSPNPRESSEMSDQELVTAIANAPPEKDEKLIILTEQRGLDKEDFGGDEEWHHVEVLPGSITATPKQDTQPYLLDLAGGPPAVMGDAQCDSGGGNEAGQQQYGLMLESGGLDSTIERAGSIAADISALRSAFKELDDSQSQLMRHLIMRKSGGREDILGLAMALRITRLQNAKVLGPNLKNRLAMETLQLWAPISFQLGVNAKLPELEVHSYVLLFPRSFSSFINWYTAFRPIAKKVLTKFQVDLEDSLLADPIIPRFASKVLIQSRLKSPSSAFKKMVKSDSKQRHQLYDMLGVRVIITDRPQNPMEAMVSDHFDMNVYETVNTECDFDFDEIDEDKEGFSDEEERDNLVISLVNSNGNDFSVPSTTNRATEVYEAQVVGYVKDLILTLPRWLEDKTRFKDYVTRPKMSGYQSMHMTLVHAATGVNLEVQLRSSRMHMEAEYGRASHTKYKAMMLPASVDRSTNETDIF